MHFSKTSIPVIRTGSPGGWLVSFGIKMPSDQPEKESNLFVIKTRLQSGYCAACNVMTDLIMMINYPFGFTSFITLSDQPFELWRRNKVFQIKYYRHAIIDFRNRGRDFFENLWQTK